MLKIFKFNLWYEKYVTTFDLGINNVLLLNFIIKWTLIINNLNNLPG